MFPSCLDTVETRTGPTRWQRARAIEEKKISQLNNSRSDCREAPDGCRSAGRNDRRGIRKGMAMVLAAVVL